MGYIDDKLFKKYSNSKNCSNFINEFDCATNEEDKKKPNNLVEHDIETDEDSEFIRELFDIVNAINYCLYEYFKKGSGLKILTPNQLLSRLRITLAQLKVGNNSEELKNGVRQLLFSLYRSKKLTKQLYKSLVDII